MATMTINEADRKARLEGIRRDIRAFTNMLAFSRGAAAADVHRWLAASKAQLEHLTGEAS